MSKPNADVVAGKAARYCAIAEDVKNLGEEKSGLAVELKNLAATYGMRDEYGSSTLDAGPFRIKNECRKTHKINEEVARRILSPKKLWKKVVQVETVEKVDADELEHLFLSGEITEAEMRQMIHEDLNFAIRVSRRPKDADPS